MYKIIRNVIESKEYKLEDILYKIDKMYIQDRITEKEKTELDSLARDNANIENSYSIQKQLDSIFERLEALENKDKPEEPIEPVEEYEEYRQPKGAHDSYNKGDKVIYNGKKYICEANNCVWSPETYPAFWTEVIEDVVEESEE